MEFSLPIQLRDGKIQPARTLGVRLVVGQQTLDLFAEVRILHPQPGTGLRTLEVVYFCLWGRFR